jgi:hypothetical protein
MKWIAIITYLGVLLGVVSTLLATYRQESEKLKANGETPQIGSFLRQHPITIGLFATLLVGGMSVISTFKQENEKSNEKVQAEAQKTETAKNEAAFQKELNTQNKKMLELQAQLSERSEQIANLYKRIAKSQDALRSNADEQLKLQINIREKSEQITSLYGQITTAQIKLRERSEEIVRLTKQTGGAITGGGYCYFDFAVETKAGSELPIFSVLYLSHTDNLPLYDLSYELVDLEEQDVYLKKLVDQVKKGEPLNLNSPYKGGQIGNIRPNDNFLYINKIAVTNPERFRYQVIFRARNGSWMQHYSRKLVNGKFEQADTLVSGSGKVIHESISLNFPRNQKGEPIM